MTEPLNESEELEEVRDRPWRDRVVARSLGAATRQTLDRAQALIEATIQLLETSGESVTVQDVADKAGYSLRVLYRQFSSKEDLLAAVLESQLETAAERMRKQLAKLDDPVERLTEFIRLRWCVPRRRWPSWAAIWCATPLRPAGSTRLSPSMAFIR